MIQNNEDIHVELKNEDERIKDKLSNDEMNKKIETNFKDLKTKAKLVKNKDTDLEKTNDEAYIKRI